MEHPEVELLEVENTLVKPDVLHESDYDENVSWYFKYNKKMWQNKMKYHCKQCDFNREGTSNIFDKVCEHEKIHLKKIEEKRTRMKNNVITM